MRKEGLFISSIFFLILSCSDDHIAKTSGTRLISIEGFSDGEHSLENYSYDALGKLTRVEDNDIWGLSYLIEYSGDVIKQFFILKNNDQIEISRDSFAYNLLGQIEKIYKFYAPSNELEWIYEYEYDIHEKVS